MINLIVHPKLMNSNNYSSQRWKTIRLHLSEIYSGMTWKCSGKAHDCIRHLRVRLCETTWKSPVRFWRAW